MNEEDIDPDVGDAIADTVRSTLGEDISIGVRLQGPPKGDWSTIITPKFKHGELVVYKSFNDDECEDIVWAMKVVGWGTKPDTYMVKKSGERDVDTVDVSEIKKAPFDAKWESYYDRHNFMNVPGLKISCPSNDAIKNTKR